MNEEQRRRYGLTPDMEARAIIAETLTPAAFLRWLEERRSWSTRNWWAWYQTYLDEQLASVDFHSHLVVIPRLYHPRIDIRAVNVVFVAGRESESHLLQMIAPDWVQEHVALLFTAFLTYSTMVATPNKDGSNMVSVYFMIDRLMRLTSRKQASHDLPRSNEAL